MPGWFQRPPSRSYSACLWSWQDLKANSLVWQRIFSPNGQLAIQLPSSKSFAIAIDEVLPVIPPMVIIPDFLPDDPSGARLIQPKDTGCLCKICLRTRLPSNLQNMLPIHGDPIVSHKEYGAVVGGICLFSSVIFEVGKDYLLVVLCCFHEGVYETGRKRFIRWLGRRWL